MSRQETKWWASRSLCLLGVVFASMVTPDGPIAHLLMKYYALSRISGLFSDRRIFDWIFPALPNKVGQVRIRR